MRMARDNFEIGGGMDGWNFLEGPVKPRNELRDSSENTEEESVSIEERIDRVRIMIVEALRDFPDAYRAVVERLRQAELRGET